MSKPVSTCRLSAADAAFLYLERKEIPLHIASVCLFDGPIPFAEFVFKHKLEAASGSAVPADPRGSGVES